MPGPLRLTLEFSRRDGADQPHEFHFVPQTYHLRDPGGHVDVAELPWTHELLADLAALRGADADAAVAFRVGAVLQRFLERTSWAAHEPRIVEASRAGASITITIRSAAAELYGLPWELLTLRNSQQMLGGIPGLVVRYEWPGSTTASDSVLPAARRGRLLFAWSAAGGAVPAADHLAAIKAHVHGFDPARDVIRHANFAAIADALEHAARVGPPIDVLHLLCHGAATGATYGLALDGDRDPVVVDAGRIQQLLAPHAGMLRTVLVAACDGGDSGAAGHLGSVAQMIHRAGLRAVIASRFPLSAAGSTRFVSAFHAAAARKPLAQAFVAARDALVRDPSQFDWASVQLYARADEDGDTPLPVARARGPTRLVAGITAALALAIVVPTLTGPAEPTIEPTAAPPAPAEPAAVAPTAPAEPVLPAIVPPATLPVPRPETDPPVPKDTRATPKRTPRLGPTSGPLPTPNRCNDDIKGFLTSNLGSQPKLVVEIDDKGTIKATPKSRGADFGDAKTRRGELEQLTGHKSTDIPCTITLEPQ